MNGYGNFKVMGTSLFVALALGACGQPGPAESAGRTIDQTADSMGKGISNAAEKVGDSLSAKGADAGVAIDDTEITAKVKAAIFAEPGLRTLQINVETIKGVVTLSGTVDSQASSDRVKVLAAAVTGVTDVANNLIEKSAKFN